MKRQSLLSGFCLLLSISTCLWRPSVSFSLLRQPKASIVTNIPFNNDAPQIITASTTRTLRFHSNQNSNDKNDDDDDMCSTTSTTNKHNQANGKPKDTHTKTPGLLRRTFPSFSWHKLPNWLTYLRCGAIPGIILLFYKELYGWTSLVFATTCATDWLDGYLARRWGVTSAFGAFLDPVADKMIVSTSLILLAGHHGAIVAVPASVILARELAVTALREWMAQEGLRDIVKVGFQGKVKTALTMLSITMMFLPQLETMALTLLYASAIVTVTSGSVYFRAAAPILMKE